MAGFSGNIRKAYVESKIAVYSHAYCKLQRVPTLYSQASPTTMSNLDPYELRKKYKRFRILVIGRANAGKTTLLQRVCNTTEDPCIYDDDKNLVSVQRSEDNESFFSWF